MKGAKIAALALAVLLGSAALAQVHGVPASVTSIRNTPWGFTPGPRASVTSLGPAGFGGCGATPGLVPSALGCNNPIFYPNVNFSNGQVMFNGVRTHRPRVPRGGFYGGGYAYPVYVPVMDYSDYTEPAVAQQPPPPMAPVQPVQIQIQIEDKRASAQPQEAMAAPAPPPAPEAPGPATVLIFRDGHQEEIQNYAIVGQTLYDLGTFIAHKIPLSSLDLNKTVKANEDRGVEFTLPASYKG